jgi:hypothetical protein
MKIKIALLFIFVLPFTILAQSFNVIGKVTDATDSNPLESVSATLISQKDTNSKKNMVTNEKGMFFFIENPSGKYLLRITYLGYNKKEVEITVLDNNKFVGTIALEPNSSLLKGITVEGQQTRGVQKGDTSEFNAGAYKVNQDANAEDLVRKMPGVTIENGQVKAQGENVRKVLIDGKEFFGDDPSMALKSLPADQIDKVQVYDKKSDMSKFTGFDDGNSEKTINILTKLGNANGNFGKAFAGYGTEERYNSGLNFNHFKGNTRLSVVSMFNNVNQQNFSFQDIIGMGTGETPPWMKMMSRTGGSGGGGMRMGMMGGNGGGGNNSGLVDPSSFFVNQQNGINNTNAIGLNYIDKWGKKIGISTSYFFNKTDNTSINYTNRDYIIAGGNGLNYIEDQNASSANYNHRFTLRMEYALDSMNEFIFTPKINYQSNIADNITKAENKNKIGLLINKISTKNFSDRDAISITNNLLYRHKFGIKGRTIALEVNHQINNKDAYSTLTSSIFDTLAIQQSGVSTTKGNTISGTISYTEPAGKNAQILLSYNPTLNNNSNDKRTNNLDGNGKVLNLDTLLTNNFENKIITHKAGASYRYNLKGVSFSAGFNLQNVALLSDQTFPFPINVDKTFFNFLPDVQLQMKLDSSSNLRFNYRTNTNAPSINQLQNLLNNSNPLQLSTGNPNLAQQYQHNISGRYNTMDMKTNRMIFSYFNFSISDNYIGNATNFANDDTTIQGVNLKRGEQLTRPVNLSGNWSGRVFFTYGFPFKPLKSNLNINTGVNYTVLPGLINDAINLSKNLGISAGFNLGSNISQMLDFNLNINGNYSSVKNTLQIQANTNYYIQTTGFKINYLPSKHLVFTPELNHTWYTGLGVGYNQSIWMTNMGIGYKFLKGNAAEIRLSVFDIFNQNTAITRNVTETYVEDISSNVLKRYGMLTFTYNLKQYGGGNKSMMMGGGMPPMGLPPGR